MRSKPQSAERRAAREGRAKKPSSDSSHKVDALAHVSKKRALEKLPVILTAGANEDYALMDSGNGLKLERYGRYRIIRPEAQAFWQPQLAALEWENADAVFTGDLSEEGAGRWDFPKGKLEETWPLAFDGISYLGRFTAFRHVGVFPEQGAHWRFVQERIRGSKRHDAQPFKLLNLFGYTGLASLVGARAGAHVTHVDASKKAIGWARENQDLAGLNDRPIRWICEDAVRFCEREVRRGNRYDGVLLDPPKYGRGPKGEVWQLFEGLPHLMDVVRELTDAQSSFVVLTAYSIRSSFFAMHEIMQEKFGDLGGTIESGELTLATEKSDRMLSTSLFSRWVLDP